MSRPRLTTTERSVLEAIRKHPFTSQRALADKLNIARTTVATHIEKLQSKGYLLGRAYVLAEHPTVCCFGGASVDHARHLAQPAIHGTSNPCTGASYRGGVARNVAENLARLGIDTLLVSAVGDDLAGATLIEETRSQGVNTDAVAVEIDHATGSYTAILEPNGELYIGVSDFAICEALDRALVDRHWKRLSSADLVFADANAPADTLAYLLDRCHRQSVRLCFDAVSIPKASRLPADLSGVEILFCNLDEARVLLDERQPWDMQSAARALCAKGAAHAVVSAGADGLCYGNRESATVLRTRPAKIVDVTGAGDAMIAGTLSGWLAGQHPIDCCKLGLEAALATAESPERGCPTLARVRAGVAEIGT